jgi:cholesterol oxidase
MLQPRPYPGPPDWPQLNKLGAMERAADELGVPLKHPDINVMFEEGYNAAGVWQPPCNLCGDCCSGCNVGGKNTTLMNYLPDAQCFGAEIFCGASVKWVRKDGSGWTVGLEPVGFGRDKFKGEPLTVGADIVVLAAGSLGSTEILLRSAAEQQLPLSKHVGERFSGNGDVLAFGYNNDQRIDGVGLGWKAASYDPNTSRQRPIGPTITSLVDLRETENLDEGMIIEEGSIPGGLGRFLPAAMARAARLHGTDTDKGDVLSERAREIESLTRGPYHGAVNHTQTFLVMSHDGADGRLELNDGTVRVRWHGVGSKPGFERVADKLRTAVAATGGTYVPNPVWTKLFDHSLITVHPLGGCGMSNDASTGVVDHKCRVFSGTSGSDLHEGLYVCDGAVMPRSLGVNPLLTIAAVAERAMIHLARDTGRTIRLGPAQRRDRDSERPRSIGVRFTEKMAGRVWAASGADESHASFIATVIADDVDRLVNEKDHEAVLVGTVSLSALAPEPLTIRGGRWNLFVDDPAQVETKRMVYHMPLTLPDGRRLVVSGNKYIHDEKGFDLWRDTTTLRVEVREDAADAPLLFEGELTIDPRDFMRQLATMTVVGAPDFVNRMRAMATFGRFFAGALFQSFGGPFARPVLFDPHAVRVKRPLRVGTPDVHHFSTEDRKTLRFTRYRGGDKGPLILSHGLGVSSLIFSIDTIDTSMLEYLYAAGYDCWLLDYRASIALPYATEQFTADDVAAFDYPAAVACVREVTGSDTVQMVAHCYGAMSFTMAMLSGLKGVRSAVISQIGAHADVPWWPQRTLAWLRAPDLMHLGGVRHLDACARTDRSRLSRVVDTLLSLYPFRAKDRTRSVTSRRITALYGPLYEIAQLNQATMDALPEMFGKANVSAFRQLTRIARAGHVVRAGRGEPYVSEEGLRNFAIPTLFIHGELNGTFLPSSTARTVAALAKVNGPDLYERHVVAGTGHIDCIFGKQAVRDVYPRVVAHLDRTAGFQPAAGSPGGGAASRRGEAS